MSQSIEQIQYLTQNYSRLQGLRAIPVGIFVLLAGIWANFAAGNLGMPFVLLLITWLGYGLIDQYYARQYGKVTTLRQRRIQEFITGILFMVLALVSFVFDSAQVLAMSSVGLVIAAGILADFWQNISKPAYSFEAIISAALIAMLSLLPLAGWQWWHWVGVGTLTNGILILSGLLMIGMGVIGHGRLTHTLKAVEKASHEQSI
ncbi:MAG: hypothetical protein DDG60_16925 [Anaerolineae bacterium]|nr:MAG: hypothetical protein DDG60_16925 [Anaerolineae bacterium]